LTGGHDSLGAPSPEASFYFAEGTTRPGFQTYLCIANPTTSEAEIRMRYLLSGEEKKEETITVKPLSRKTVDVNAELGSGKDFSIQLSSLNQVKFVAERPMYFDFRGLTGGHDSLGAPSPEASFYFAEGTTRPGFQTYLCIANPTTSEALVRISYFRGDGATTRQELAIPAESRATVHVNDFLGSGDSPSFDFATHVECLNGAGISAERPIYFNFRGLTGGHDCSGY
ncbi:MAG: hypothetical protein PHP64_03485, partial [Actinomycetota bacterium]|nr:hypothetical protein [Actinomycetota bacterium]